MILCLITNHFIKKVSMDWSPTILFQGLSNQSMQPYAFSSSSCLRPIIVLNHDYDYGFRTISPGLHAKSRKGFFKESQGAGYNMITMCIWCKLLKILSVLPCSYINTSDDTKCNLAKSISVDLSGQRSAGRSWTPPVVRHMCFVDLVEPAAPL